MHKIYLCVLLSPNSENSFRDNLAGPYRHKNRTKSGFFTWPYLEYIFRCTISAARSFNDCAASLPSLTSMWSFDESFCLRSFWYRSFSLPKVFGKRHFFYQYTSQAYVSNSSTNHKPFIKACFNYLGCHKT
jgi:hypothetical protein